MATDSHLEQRRQELMAGEQTIPLGYEVLRERAREHVSADDFDYVSGGAGSEGTMMENRRAFRRYLVLPRVLRDVSERRLDTELFGRELAAPLVLAPVGGQAKYHEDGELATARAAANVDVPMVLANGASRSIEAVAEANGDGIRLFQLYWPRDWEVAASLVCRAEDAGYDGIVLTVDSKLPKWRQRNLGNSYRNDTPHVIYETDPVVQQRADAADVSVETFVRENSSMEDDPSIDWADLDALREWTDLPVVLKGVLAVEDARRAAEWGAEGIVVSNHGGRQIDGEVSALDQLPAITDAVDDETTVILDSGVRSGADAFTALALGADAVQFGRPYVFALAIAGQAGIEELLANYLAELESVMGLSGRPTIDAIDRGALRETSADKTFGTSE